MSLYQDGQGLCKEGWKEDTSNILGDLYLCPHLTSQRENKD